MNSRLSARTETLKVDKGSREPGAQWEMTDFPVWSSGQMAHFQCHLWANYRSQEHMCVLSCGAVPILSRGPSVNAKNG